MPSLVFVHGVNARSTPNYLAEIAVRNQLFLDVVLKGEGTIVNSSWGDLVTTWSWNQASLPSETQAGQDAAFALGAGGSDGKAHGSSQMVASLAGEEPQEAVDEVFVHLVDRAVQNRRQLTAEELRDFKAAVAYFGQSGQNQAPFTASSDALFVRELRTRLGSGDASYGLLDPLHALVKALAERAINATSSAVLRHARGGINDRVGRFLGDVFTYLQDHGDNRESIRAEVIGKLQEGAAAGGRLIVIGHSMGGIILYDLLSDPNNPLRELNVDLLVTVGSQVGVFEEMKLFRASSPAYGAVHNNRVPALSKVGRWLNVYDPVDALSFRCSGVFEGVEDFVFSSTTSFLDAHTAYFKRPRFFAHLASRLAL